VVALALALLATALPSVKWAEAGGGTGSEDADGIGADRQGRLVISGGVENAGNTDIFAVGYGRRGRVRWTRQFGAGGTDHAFDNDVDPHGNALLTGTFNRTVDFGGATLISRGGDRPAYGDAFLLKLGTAGRTKWVRQIGGSGSDGGDEVAVGPHNNVFVIGDSDGDVRFTPSTVLAATGGRDAWAARYRPDGTLVWAHQIGGAGDQQSHGISADPHSNALVTGEISDGGAPDVFLAKLGRLGRVHWFQRFGDGDREIGRGVDSDAHGNVYFGGEFAGTLKLGSHTLTSAGSNDLFFAKANRRGRVRWALRLGGAGSETGPEVEVAPDGTGYLTGFSTTAGQRVAFVAKVSPAGRLVWKLDSTDSPFATLGELSLGPHSVNVLGRFISTVTFGGKKLDSAGGTDYFLASLRR
jgi:beta-propeller repeat-containing protein